MGIPTGFSVCMGWVWALKFNPHGSPGKYSNHIKFLCFVECKRLNGLSIADSLFFLYYICLVLAFRECKNVSVLQAMVRTLTIQALKSSCYSEVGYCSKTKSIICDLSFEHSVCSKLSVFFFWVVKRASYHTRDEVRHFCYYFEAQNSFLINVV